VTIVSALAVIASLAAVGALSRVTAGRSTLIGEGYGSDPGSDLESRAGDELARAQKRVRSTP
jgi:hypothetical protein